MSKLFTEDNESIRKRCKLFCFPYAGGNASAFRGIASSVLSDFDVHILNLPGREKKISEKPYKSMEKLIEDILVDIAPLLGEVNVFLGHSLGAKIAYETAKELKNMNIHHFIAAGSGAPNLLPPKITYNLPDKEFINELRRLSGTPEVILNNPKLINFFLPAIRADFELDETYFVRGKEKIPCAVTAFWAEEDTEVSKNAMMLWREYTDNDFFLEVFKGGHFFIKDEEEQVVERVGQGQEQPPMF